MKLAIGKLTRDAGTQLRAALDEAKIIEYAEILDELPAVKVVYDGARHILWDGFHTTAAHERKGLVEVRAEVTPGDLRAAILLSCGANAAHGLPRTNEDKRRAVMRLLEDAEWQTWTDSAVAKACKVDHKTVAKYKAETHLGNSQDSRKTTRGGVEYVINTGAIGKAPRGARPILFPGEPAAEVLTDKPLPARPDPPAPAAPIAEVLDEDDEDGRQLPESGTSTGKGTALVISSGPPAHEVLICAGPPSTTQQMVGRVTAPGFDFAVFAQRVEQELALWRNECPGVFRRGLANLYTNELQELLR